MQKAAIHPPGATTPVSDAFGYLPKHQQYDEAVAALNSRIHNDFKYDPDYGDDWHDFDPTNDLIPADQHITTGWGRGYSDVTPLRGIVFGGGANQRLNVSMDVERLR